MRGVSLIARAQKRCMTTQSRAIAGAILPVSENLSVEELVAQRVRQYSEPEAETPEEIEPEETELEAAEEPEEEIPEEPEETEEEEQEIDLLSLSPEDIQALAKKGKSRLLHRVGELTAQKHALEEKLNAQADAKPLQVPQAPLENNPFKDLKTVEEIHAKFAELEKVADETDRILEDHEDYAADDVITLGDKEFTKKEIRQANRNARNAMTKFLPAQAATIQHGAELKAMEEQYNAAIPVEIPELADAESNLSKQFQALIADPLVEQVRQRVPDLAPQLGYILAHAVRSIHSKAAPKTVTPAAGPMRGKVPASPFGAAGPRSAAKPEKQRIVQAEQQFEKTGSVEDWVAARMAKLSRQ